MTQALPVDPVPSDAKLPQRAGVVVIGGGIAGSSAALALAESGVPVVLCEKGRIGAEQSSRNWGWCRKMGRDPRELPLMLESLRLWRGMNERVGSETGFRQHGVLYLIGDEKGLAKRQAWLKSAEAFQIDTRLLSGAEAEALAPGGTRRWLAGLHTPSDGSAEPQKAAPAIAAAARKRGAVIMTDCAVRGIETSAGRVSAAVTEKGRVACDAVLLAGGAWSGLFCRSLDIRLPQLKVRASVMRTAPIDGGPGNAASGPGFGMRKRLDGGYTLANSGANYHDIGPDSFRFLFDFIPALRLEHSRLVLGLGQRFFAEWSLAKPWTLDQTSPFERVRVLDPPPVESQLAAARATVAGIWPALKDMKVAGSWAGYIDATPDMLPVISPVERLPGLFLATGFSGHGFGIGPGAGRLAADLVMGRPAIVDPAPFRFSRFSDGTKIQPIAGI